jgi:hypothetical protein
MTMTTVDLTDQELAFIRARMELTAMNETGTDATMAEQILDTLAFAIACKPLAPKPAARNMGEVLARFDAMIGAVR